MTKKQKKCFTRAVEHRRKIFGMVEEKKENTKRVKNKPKAAKNR